jgi:hypothetical protein
VGGVVVFQEKLHPIIVYFLKQKELDVITGTSATKKLHT